MTDVITPTSAFNEGDPVEFVHDTSVTGKVHHVGRDGQHLVICCDPDWYMRPCRVDEVQRRS